MPKPLSPFSPRQLDCAKPISPPRLTRLIQASSLGSARKFGILDPWINFFPPQSIAESSDFFHPIHSMLRRSSSAPPYLSAPSALPPRAAIFISCMWLDHERPVRVPSLVRQKKPVFRVTDVRKAGMLNVQDNDSLS